MAEVRVTGGGNTVGAGPDNEIQLFGTPSNGMSCLISASQAPSLGLLVQQLTLMFDHEYAGSSGDGLSLPVASQ